jgi:LAO/AO transport system kinase
VEKLSLDKLLAGDRRTLSKCITLMESQKETDRAQARALIEAAMPETGGSLRIGISGVPGVGKSTFIDVFGMHLISLGKKVAVLAVDPSSPKAGGSILGDKTRMEALSRDPDAYVRPSPTNDSLGGVGNRTRETILLCEAAGFDVVIVETVGVGQSEVDVASMVDFFAVLALPNAGDELQGIKRGILEFAHMIIVNKADGAQVDAAEQARNQYESAFRLLGNVDHWHPQALVCSAVEETNIAEIWAVMNEFAQSLKQHGGLEEGRMRQNTAWLDRLLNEMINRRFRAMPSVRAVLPDLEQQVRRGQITPFAALKELEQLAFENAD